MIWVKAGIEAAAVTHHRLLSIACRDRLGVELRPFLIRIEPG